MFGLTREGRAIQACSDRKSVLSEGTEAGREDGKGELGMTELALYGGPKAKSTPFGEGKRFGEEELAQLREALDQNTLFYWSGRKVKQLCAEFAALHEVPYCVAVSSGTAAIHVALASLGVGVGDEVITSPITDWGTIIGILYQGAVPVFADVDPNTYNLDPSSVVAKITSRTKIIIAVHLAGNPCDMDAIMEIAKGKGIRVIEDCAQSYLAEYKGRKVGTFGDFGCFSLNDFKHISTGDGGLVITRDSELARLAALYADKYYHRSGSGRDPEWLAPNYRMTELQGAVGIAQVKKLPGICQRRHELGDRITQGISGLPGIQPHRITADSRATYWFYMLRVNEQELGTRRHHFCEALRAEGIPCSEGYIPRPVYCYDVLTKAQVLHGAGFPISAGFHAAVPAYGEGLCPVAEEVLATAVRLPVSEFFTDRDVDEMVAAIRKVASYFASRRAAAVKERGA